MGKSNRIRMNRANERVSAPVNKKKQMPGWLLSVIALVVVVGVLLTVVSSVMSVNGSFLRMTTPAKSENNRISGTMMSYYFWSTYQSFLSENDALIEKGSLSLNESVSLKNQTFGGLTAAGTASSDKLVLDEGEENFAGTWFDYFVMKTKSAVTSVLIYCEEAEARGITLNETELQAIEQNLSSIEMIAGMYGYDVNSYVQAQYGEGVKLKDLRKAMQLSELANKCMEVLAEEYLKAVTEAEINDRYNGNKLDYNVVDYSYYSIKVTFEDAIKAHFGDKDYTDKDITEQKADIIKKYEELVQEAQAKRDALKAITDKNKFKEKLAEYLTTEEAYKALYDAAVKELDAAEIFDNPDGIKEHIISFVISEIAKGKTETTLVVTVDGSTRKIGNYTVTEKFANAMMDVTADLFEEVYADILTYCRTEIGYIKDEETSEWLFHADRKTGDVKETETGDKTIDAGATIDDCKKKSYTVRVDLLTEAQYRDTDATKNVAHMTFTDEATAKAAMEALKATNPMTYEAFESVAKANNATYVTNLDNYAEGTIGSTVYDGWVFSEERKAGDITATPLSLADGTYAVIWLMSDGDPQWSADVRNDIASDRMESGYEALKTTHPVTFNDKAFNKLAA